MRCEDPTRGMTLFPSHAEEEWVEMDGPDQLETLLEPTLMELRNEKAEIELSFGAYEKVRRRTEQQGRQFNRDAQTILRQRVDRDRKRGDYALAARRRAVERIGLTEVRNFRLARLRQEELAWREQIAAQAMVIPELTAVTLVQVSGRDPNG